MQELTANEDNIAAWKPGFGTRMLDSLQWGWNALQEIVLFLFRIWGLILAAGIIFITYRWLKNPRKTDE